MKKAIVILVIIIMMFYSVHSFATIQTMGIEVDGRLINSKIKPFVDLNSVTMVPIRPIAEAVAAEVSWDGLARRVTIQKDNLTLVFLMDSKFAYKNGRPVQMDNKPIIVHNIFFVPVRFLSDALEIPIEVDSGSSNLTILSQDFETELIQKRETVWKIANEELCEWTIRSNGTDCGTLLLNKFLLNNGDYYYFLRYTSQITNNQKLSLELPITLKDFHYRFIIYPEGLNFQKSEWSLPVLGNLNSTLPNDSVFIEALDGSAFLSYVNVFENQKNDVRNELYDSSPPLKIKNGRIIVEVPQQKNLIFEQWGIISSQNLVDWQHSTNSIDLRIADLNRVRKWSIDGYYEITPSSYYPSAATSFWRVPAHPIGEKFLRTDGSRIFDDFANVSLYTAVKTQNDKGSWPTSPRSNWLFADYSIDSYFFDTRFNTDTGLFLLKGYQKQNDQALLDAAIKYGDYLLDFANTHHYKTKNGGYLVFDYGHDSMPKVRTHVSLNHLLTEMNFFYELYRTTGLSMYLKVARSIRTAVEDTAPNWQNTSDGDLWYAYFQDGTYGLKDYPLLTLRDLRYSLELINDIDGVLDNSINYLIKVKTDYLKKYNLPIY